MKNLQVLIYSKLFEKKYLRAQERPAILILTVISGCVLRVRAMFITGTLKPEIEILFCN